MFRVSSFHSFSPHPETRCFHLFTHQSNHFLFLYPELEPDRFKRSSVFPCHFYDSVCLLNRKLFCHNEVNSDSIKTKSVWFCFNSMGKTMEAYQPLNAVTFRTAALDILKATGEPMHYTEIARVAIKTGYWRQQDEEFIKQHMYQAIKSDIRKKRFGSIFEEVAPGTYQVNKVIVKD